MFTCNGGRHYFMFCVSKYILTIGILVAMTVCCASAAIPQVCKECNPDTYPGSPTCPSACRVAFPADAEWTYPVVEEVIEEVEEIPAYLTSTLSGITLAIPVLDPEFSKFTGNRLSAPAIDTTISKLSGKQVSDQEA